MSQPQIHPTACIDPGAEIGENTKIWHFCHVGGTAHIGKNCSLGQNVFVAGGAKVGDGSRIQNNVAIYEGVELKENVFCGPGVIFTNVLRPRVAYPAGGQYRRTVVESGATLGAGTVLLSGIRVGRGAMTAAGSIITRSVPDHALMVGSPAKLKGYVCACGEKLGDDMVCPACGKKYRLTVGKNAEPACDRTKGA